MPRRRFNWKLVIILLIGLGVLGLTAFGLRKWQRNRIAYGALEKGNRAYDEYNWKEAAENLGRYVGVVQDDVPVLFKYADAQLNIRPLKSSNVQQAIATYRIILRIDKTNTEAALRLVGIYLQMGMSGEAELIAARALEGDPALQEKGKMGTQTKQSLELRRLLAVAFAQQRKFKEAVEKLKEIIKEHPEQILAYELLGQLIEQRPEDYSQDPLFWFDEAVRNNPSAAQAYVIRGAYYLRHGDKAKALADFKQAEQQDLSDPAVRLRLAGELVNADVFDEAEKHLVAVQKVEPVSQTLWQTWARLALKSDSKTTMLKVAETGLKELYSQPWDFMPIAVELYIRCDKLDLADDCINKLRQNDIAPATTAFFEGLIADKEGKSYEAVEHLYKALQLGGEPARIRLALALKLSDLGDKQSAIKQLRTLVLEQPNLFSGHVTLAKLLVETGKWSEAVEQAYIALEISPKSLYAALLYIQARIQLLAETQTDNDSPAWREIEDYLAKLEKTSDEDLPIKVSQLQLAVKRSQFDKAWKLLSDINNNYPSQIEVALAEVELLTAQGKTDEVEQKLYETIEAFPRAVSPLRHLVTLLAAKENYQECEVVIKNALTRAEQPAARRETALLLADLYNRLNEHEKCYKLLSSFVNDIPNDILLQRKLLGCQKVMKDSDHAQRVVDQIKAIEGQQGWQWRYEQAKIWFVQDSFKDHYSQIISLLKENLRANPDDQSSRVLLAATYEKAGQLPLAISIYSEALNRSPQDLRIIIPAVTVLYKANEYERADEILRQADNRKLYHPELKKMELQSHLRRGRLDSAGNILEDILTKDPDNSSIGLTLALLKMRQGKFIEADKLLSSLKTKDPNSLPITVAQIQLNVRQNKSTEAISLCDKIINRLNDASAYILRGRTFASLHQVDNAEKDFEQATVIEPDNAGAWAAKSDFYRSVNQVDKAVADIEKAMSLAPDDIIIQKRAISLFFVSADKGTIKKGKDLLDDALTANPEDFELRLYKSRSLLTEGNAPALEQATNILKKLTEEQPKLSTAWGMLAETALQQAQPIKAMDIVFRGLFHQPNDKSLLFLKARLEATRSPSLAIPTLKALHERFSNDINIVMFLTQAYIDSGRPREAVDLLETQLTVYSGTPDERRIHLAMAVALHKNGQQSEAQEKFNSLMQSAPDDPGPLLAQVRLLTEDQLWSRLNSKVIDWYRNHPEDTQTAANIAGDLADNENSQARKIAEDLLRKILDHDPDSLQAMKTLAMLLQIMKRSNEAVPFYQRLLELEPENVIAMNNLAWILCDEQGKYQQALELAQRGLRIAPDYVDLIDTRGVLYDKLGQYDKAIQDFTRCLELYPDKTPARVASYLHLGRTLAKLGRKDEAVESLRKSLELNTEIKGLSDVERAEAQDLVKNLLN